MINILSQKCDKVDGHPGVIFDTIVIKNTGLEEAMGSSKSKSKGNGDEPDRVRLRVCARVYG